MDRMALQVEGAGGKCATSCECEDFASGAQRPVKAPFLRFFME